MDDRHGRILNGQTVNDALRVDAVRTAEGSIAGGEDRGSGTGAGGWVTCL